MSFSIRLIETPIKLEELKKIAELEFGEFTKAVVDLKKQSMVISMTMHVDGETFFIDQDSMQEDLWGINLHPEKQGDDLVEFDSMINIRPSQNNRSRYVEDANIRKDIIRLVKSLIDD